ncbi:hypothetical protein TVAGG3_0902320, partial [Trichomonas vaginalis G3]|uniref:hypothetical protein n=1 Tax=Trichomonas vaginalis (strain ATCC PRA-98 / G3) TaxID=412133 RepID=UPI0021E5B37B
MTDVPPTESIPKPEKPKAPALHLSSSKYLIPASTSVLLPISTSRLLPTTRLPNTLLNLCLTPQPLDVPASSPQQFQSHPNRRETRHRKGLNRLRKEYATAPMEDDRLSVSSLNRRFDS